MKKIKTSSYFTFIIETKNNKFVRQYKRDKREIHGYPRTVPVNKVMKLLENSNVYAPSILRNRLKYIDEEYIDGIQVDDNIDNTLILDCISNYIIQMSSINCHSIYKYIGWGNNTEYLMFLIDNLIRVKDTFSVKTKDILDKLDIGNTRLNELKNIKLDNSRKMSLIHGDIHKGNMIMREGKIYLLDWELATYGDIAYEVATHSLLMNYNLEDTEYLIDKISDNIDFDRDNFFRDIRVYVLYELLRRCYLNLNKIDRMMSKGENIENEIEILYKYYDRLVEIIGISKLPKEKVKYLLEVNHE